MLIFTLLSSQVTHAQLWSEDVASDILETPYQGTGTLKEYKFSKPITHKLTFKLSPEAAFVIDDYNYAGMSAYLGFAPMIKVEDNRPPKTVKLKNKSPVLTAKDWIGFKGRFKSIMLSTQTGEISLSQDLITVRWEEGDTPDLKLLYGLPDSSAVSLESLPDVRTLQYVHLPRGMRVLCRFVESLYKAIASLTGLGWGLSLFLFAVIIKVILLPVAILTKRLQAEASSHSAALGPIFKDIKENFKGETAHNKTMAAYKARGITPYYSLKPFLATMISLPVLIAIFNMLGEVEPLTRASFLWIESLAYPDEITKLPFALPLLGNTLNILPFIMTGVTCLSAYTLKIPTASRAELKRQKRNLYLMGIAFFFIFYPFPSGMVLYWTLSTSLQFVISKLSKRL